MPAITFTIEDDVALPEAFVLICNASGYGPINMMPIYHLGKERIKKLVINCGIYDRSNPTQQESNSAVVPARRLKAFALQTLKLKNEDIMIVDNDPDAFLGWESGIAWAASHRLPILANFQGGTTQMSMGCEHALQASNANWMRLFVSKYPASVRIPVLVGNDFTEILWDDELVEERVPLDILLTSLGYQLKNHTTGDGGDVTHQANRLYDRFITKVGKNRPERNTVLATMNNSNRDNQSLASQSPSTRALLSAWYGRNDHAIPWANGVFTNKAQQEFFYGGWLERAIFDQIRVTLEDDPNFSISLNFEVSLEGKTATANEIDILIRHRDVFHLVEVKTSRTTDYLNAAADKMIGINRILCGAPSRSWLIAPFAHFGDQPDQIALKNEFIQRLNQKGITVLMGDGAVEQLHREIGELV
jgi:Domain of unknown function (DUF1887)